MTCCTTTWLSCKPWTPVIIWSMGTLNPDPLLPDKPRPLCKEVLLQFTTLFPHSKTLQHVKEGGCPPLSTSIKALEFTVHCLVWWSSAHDYCHQWALYLDLCKWVSENQKLYLFGECLEGPLILSLLHTVLQTFLLLITDKELAWASGLSQLLQLY